MAREMRAEPRRMQEREGRRDRPDRERHVEREIPKEDHRQDRGFDRRGDRGDYHPQPRSRQEARGWQKDRGWQRNGGWQPHDSWREHRAENWEAAHRTWAQRGGYGGYYIPRDRFYAYYGPRNYFRFRPTIYMGYPRFWYGQYWFQIVDPWPYGWDEDWYDSGDCYIDFVGDGYYLFNRRHPGVALAITVSL